MSDTISEKYYTSKRLMKMSILFLSRAWKRLEILEYDMVQKIVTDSEYY
jgi:hypothetical protein